MQQLTTPWTRSRRRAIPLERWVLHPHISSQNKKDGSVLHSTGPPDSNTPEVFFLRNNNNINNNSNADNPCPENPGLAAANRTITRGGAFDSSQPVETTLSPVGTNTSEHTPFGNRLSSHLRAWYAITTDRWVLTIIKDGYSIEFDALPPSGVVRSTPPSDPLLKEVRILLSKGAIIPVPRGQRHRGFYSRYFAVPKRDGGVRPILDLRDVNTFIAPKKFRMTSLTTILPLLMSTSWFASIDLTDAYFHIAIRPFSQQFLRFAIGNRSYQFQVLPFGLSTAPRVFTKCMAVVAAHFRTRGIQIHPYIDDWLVVADSFSRLTHHIKYILKTLQDLGLQINREKSHLIPTRSIKFIGAILDASRTRAFLPRDRALGLRQLAHKLLRQRRVTAYSIQRLLGLMASTTAVTPFARLKMRRLQSWFNSIFNPLWPAKRIFFHLPDRVLRSLIWWTHRSNLLAGIPFQLPMPSMTLTTDASLRGWGAHLFGLSTQGLWSRKEQRNHINLLELLAVYKALRAFETQVSGHHIQVTSDNTTVVFYINKQGGTRSRKLIELTLHIWEWCIHRRITLTAVHIAGDSNTRADQLSRVTSTAHEWQLHPEVLHLLFRKWGTPTLDMFATAQNSVCRLFCSRAGKGANSLGDAFTLPWTSRFIYLFPPIPLITRTLTKITHDNADCLLITPWWPRQDWFPIVQNRSRGQWLHLPRRPDLITQNQGRIRHADLDSLHLTAWRLHPV